MTVHDIPKEALKCALRAAFRSGSNTVHVRGLPLLNCAVCGHRQITVYAKREVARANVCPRLAQN